MNLKGTTTSKAERAVQLFFRDDRQFEIRHMPLKMGFVVEMVKQQVIRAWLMPYGVLKRFDGWAGIGACMMLISYGRDIICDPFRQLQQGEKPEVGGTLIKSQISDIATSVCYQHERGPKRSDIDKIVMWLGVALTGITIALVVLALKGAAGG